MKVGTVLMAVALLGAPASAQEQLPNIDGTAANFPMDEGGDTWTSDATGNGHDGTLSGSVQWEAGRDGSPALHFYDRDGCVELRWGIDMSGDWTIQGWTLFPLERTSDGWRTFVQNGSGHHHVLVDQDGTLGVFIDGFYKCDTGYNVNGLDGWHLLSAVGSEGRTIFYVDGEQVGVVEVQEKEPLQYIGNYVGGGQNWGTIDSLRVLSVARSADEIAADAGSQSPLPTPTPDPILPVIAGTRAVYSFGEGTGNRTADGSANAFHANLSGSPAWENALIGTGLNFSNYGAYVSTPSIDVGGTWTLQAWTRFPLNTTSDGWRTLFQYGSGHHHVLVAQDGALGVFINGFHSSGYNVTGLGGWHLLSAVGVGGQTKFYVDGEPAGSADVVETLPVQFIGNHQGGGQNWGLVDGVRILDVARSDAEIVVDANPTPTAPAAPAQVTPGGATIGPAGSVHGDFVVRAGVSQIIGYAVKLQVEMKPVTVAFDGTGILEGVPAASGGTATVRVPGPATGDRRWRVRAMCAGGGAPSAWVDRGTASLTEVDIRFLNATPVVATAAQVRVSDGSAIATGGELLDSDQVKFVVAGTDADLDEMELQVEMVPVDAGFAGQATFRSGLLPAAPPLSCVGTPGKGRQKWQYRIVDSMGAASAWTAHATGGATADFEVVWTGSKAGSGCAGSAGAAGAGLLAAASALLALRRR